MSEIFFCFVVLFRFLAFCLFEVIQVKKILSEGQRTLQGEE